MMMWSKNQAVKGLLSRRRSPADGSAAPDPKSEVDELHEMAAQHCIDAMNEGDASKLSKSFRAMMDLHLLHKDDEPEPKEG